MQLRQHQKACDVVWTAKSPYSNSNTASTVSACRQWFVFTSTWQRDSRPLFHLLVGGNRRCNPEHRGDSALLFCLFALFLWAGLTNQLCVNLPNNFPQAESRNSVLTRWLKVLDPWYEFMWEKLLLFYYLSLNHIWSSLGVIWTITEKSSDSFRAV